MGRPKKKSLQEQLADLIYDMAVEELVNFRNIFDVLIEEKSGNTVFEEENAVVAKTPKVKVKRVERAKREVDDEGENEAPRRSSRGGAGKKQPRVEAIAIPNKRPNLFVDMKFTGGDKVELDKAAKDDKLLWANRQKSERTRTLSLIEVDCDRCGKPQTINEDLYGGENIGFYCNKCVGNI